MGLVPRGVAPIAADSGSSSLILSLRVRLEEKTGKRRTKAAVERRAKQVHQKTLSYIAVPGAPTESLE
ncbi:hypothetical protein CDL15_Pgr008247 [Punica granatum]|uniref:Uncharacterized protein n=1 Tax=Punica granatum TaxID=22663 RepID=A0A218VT13_PUNGR|nr:hypothetical protein CDL15_Pgr008247 [Punica granatum]